MRADRFDGCTAVPILFDSFALNWAFLRTVGATPGAPESGASVVDNSRIPAITLRPVRIYTQSNIAAVNDATNGPNSVIVEEVL